MTSNILRHSGTALLLAFPFALASQAADPPFNTTLLGSIAPGVPDYADVWGDGQYVYMGRFLQNAVDIVDISNPASPVDLGTYTIASPNTGASAQDLKVAPLNGQNLLFVGLEFNDPHGVQIVDISNPASPTLLTNIDTEPGNFEEIHNVFIEDEWLYMDNSADNTISILDLRSYNPLSPPTDITAWTYQLTSVGNVFVHDVTVQNDRLYASAWGSLEIYDTTNIATQAPNLIGSVLGISVHAAWASDDGQFVVTSEERGGGGLRLFEIIQTSPTSVRLVQRDSFVLPANNAFSVHNPLWVGDRIYSSFYQYGGVALELDRTTKTMELVASYDTSDITSSGFNGNWGCYPLGGVDKVLLSDLENGLYIVDFSALQISFPSARPEIVTPGATNFITVEIEELGNSTLNAATLQLNSSVNGGGTVSSAMTNIGGNQYRAALPNVPCGADVEYWITVDDNQGRSFSDPATAPADRHVAYGAYGLNTVFEDNFETNLGWTVSDSGSLTSGTWERGNPIGTGAQMERGDEEGTGQNCFFTQNGVVGGSDGAADVDGGTTTVTSPVMDFSAGDGLVRYSRWMFGSTVDSDNFEVEVTNNGSTWVQVENFTQHSGGWIKRRFRVSDYVTPSANVRVRFSVSDDPNNSLTEGGLDEVQAQVFDCTAPAPTGIKNKRPNGSSPNRP